MPITTEFLLPQYQYLQKNRILAKRPNKNAPNALIKMRQTTELGKNILSLHLCFNVLLN